MKVIFNSNVLDFQDVKMSQTNRAFKYGDGLFETISFNNGQPRFLGRHLKRLRNGMRVLRMCNNPILSIEPIRAQLHKLKVENGIESRGKSRIYVWRYGRGLYSPLENTTDVLLTLENDNSENISFSENVGFSEDIMNHPSRTSQFKTISALSYVLAGIEKTEKQLDDIIIKDLHGNISETLSSNLFIKVKDKYLTPALSTGCINGVMRNWLIDSMKKKNISVKEAIITVKELLNADCVFTTNSLGISHVKKVDKITFTIDEQINRIVKELDSI